MTITELAIKRPTLVVVIFAALTVLGLFGFSKLNYELLPKISPPVLTISTIYPGASPYEVETAITKKIEDAVSSLDQIDAVNSTSAEGVSFIFVQFQQSTNIDIALQNAQRKIGEVVPTLPATAKAPTVSKFALDEIPVLRMGLTSNMPSREFYQFIKDQVQPRLSKLAGVAQITVIGGDEREIRINLDLDKIQSYGLSILQVTNAIKASNLDFPTGKLEDSKSQFIVRVAGKFTSVDDLRKLVISRSRQGGDIRLSDVAEVEDGQKDYKNISRINGITSVGLMLQKQTDANAVEVSKLVRQEIVNLEKDYKAQQLKFNIAQDGSLFTIDAANAVKEDLLLAIFLVAIVMLLFLHSIRNSIIVMLAIPASMIATFFVMYMLGFTLNLMTLLGLSLIVGILVDDSIVVLENIYHHLEKGEKPRIAALKGRNEIGFAALAITFVDVVVFVPLAMTGGIVGNILRQFAVVVVISTLLSLFVSFTVTPLLASRIAKLERLTNRTIIGRFSLWFEKQFKNFTASYINLLKWALVNRGKVISLVVVLFVAALSLAPLGFIGAEFMTQTDRGEFSVTLELPSGSSLQNTNFTTQSVEKMISRIPEVEKLFVNVGASSEGLVGQSANNTSELNVTLLPKNQRKRSTDEIGDQIKNYVRTFPGVKVHVNPIGIFGTANQTPIQLFVKGPDRDDVMKAAKQISNVVQTVPGTSDVRLSSEDGKPETRIEINREKLAAFGLSVAEVGSALRVALTGDDESKFRDGNNEFDIRIVLDKFDRSNFSDLGRLTFVNARGQSIQLQQFADVYQSIGPTKLQRKDRINSVIVYSQAVGRPTGSIGADIKTKLADFKFPTGVTLSYEGDLKNQGDSFGSLGLALMAAILFVYMIMVALYDSFIYPFVVLFSIPVAMIGAFLALALTMKSLSIFSILGIIMLIGLVAKNAILLVDRTNQMKAEGLSTFDALLEAGQARIRPIVMTTTSMVFGMLPIALSGSSGSEWKTGLAWALIGGLTSSMFFTLVLVPVIYVKADQWKEKFPALARKIFRRKEKELDIPVGAVVED